MDKFEPIHKHLIVSSVCDNPPSTVEDTNEFLQDLVEAVGMKVIAGPTSVMVEEEGNEGPTGTIVGTITLATSHAAIHSWTVTGRVEWCLYSCKEFNPQDALNVFSRFNPNEINWKLIDRDKLNKI